MFCLNHLHDTLFTPYLLAFGLLNIYAALVLILALFVNTCCIIPSLCAILEMPFRIISCNTYYAYTCYYYFEHTSFTQLY
ncbi:hypothetical protein HanIR_Chr04g0161541 [Helianthus annuus]|nr:hypothetical protein HanIR_Chr04g0161541 [Helianthus annuus]